MKNILGLNTRHINISLSSLWVRARHGDLMPLHPLTSERSAFTGSVHSSFISIPLSARCLWDLFRPHLLGTWPVHPRRQQEMDGAGMRPLRRTELDQPAEDRCRQMEPAGQACHYLLCQIHYREVAKFQSAVPDL